MTFLASHLKVVAARIVGVFMLKLMAAVIAGLLVLCLSRRVTRALA